MGTNGDRGESNLVVLCFGLELWTPKAVSIAGSRGADSGCFTKSTMAAGSAAIVVLLAVSAYGDTYRYKRQGALAS